MELNSRAKIKVTEFDWSKLAAVDTENILRFEVTMGNTLGVKEL